MKMRLVLPAAAAAVLIVGALNAQVKPNPLPRIVEKDGRYALMVDGAPYLALAAQTRNSSAWPSVFPKLWPMPLGYMQVNTVETPVYWNQFEPQPGHYDTSSVDMLLAEARKHQVRLVLLWFATWKNGSQHFMPDWMKLDPAKYAHAIGKNGKAVDSPSPFATASLEADKTAFAALMRHLKEADPQHTVIMVQVENESGDWGSVRDFSPVAQKVFEAPVPPEVLKAMGVTGSSPAPSWQDAFGADADEYFNAWSIAKYVGQVAAAGKAVYPLPMYANASLRNPLKPGPASTYESGGPTDNVLPIWKAEAPALDILAPDNYQTDPAAYVKDLELYARADNPLFVPETGRPINSRFFFTALGLGAIGLSPSGGNTEGEFKAGVDSQARRDFLEPWAMNNRLLGPMQREIAWLNFEGKLRAVAEEQGKPTQTLTVGDWTVLVSYGGPGRGPATGNPTPEGRVLVGQLAENQFLVTGYFCHVDFRPAGTEEQRRAGGIEIGAGQNPSAKIDGKWQTRQFLKVEEGTYENGVFKFLRILNGDETDWGLSFTGDPLVVRVSLATY
jgi:hypothetical protein